MDDQFVEDVNQKKEGGMSERDIAAELNIPRNQVRKALQAARQSRDSLTQEERIRAVIREELDADRKAQAEKDKVNDKADRRFPVVRKLGGGVEEVSPEVVLKEYWGGTPDGEIELRAIMKFRAAMLMVMDLVNIQKVATEADAKRITPILSLMKETREEQDAAAARAKASSEDIADRAAEKVAAQLFGAVTQNNAQVSGSLDQIRQALTGKSDDPFSQLLNMLQSMQQMSQMFGMPNMMPAGSAGLPSGGAQPAPTNPIERHSLNELEG